MISDATRQQLRIELGRRESRAWNKLVRHYWDGKLTPELMYATVAGVAEIRALVDDLDAKTPPQVDVVLSVASGENAHG